MTALSAANTGGHLEVVDLLVRAAQPSEEEPVSYTGETLADLMIAIQYGDQDKFQEFTAQVTDLNFED